MAFTLCTSPQLVPVTRTLADALRLPVDVLTGQDTCGLVYLHIRREKFVFTHRLGARRYIIAAQHVGTNEIDAFMDHEFSCRADAQATLDAIAQMQPHAAVMVRRPDLVGHWR